jgi:dTDP-4-dehydrorhamnose 3,5-epimerase
LIYRETSLPEVFLIEVERIQDARGFFARTWCAEEFREHGLDPDLAQCSISFNRYRGTLRGMHYQAAPGAETKVVRCTRGRLYDVVLDLRSDSPTFRKWYATELSADNRRMLYIPKGVAHGFLTLADATEVLYQISTPYAPDLARGVRWNDRAFGIRWPAEPLVVSERDRGYPDFAA